MALIRGFACIFAAAGLLPWPAHAQKPAALPQDTVARVGVSAITARDLLQRLELMPFPGRTTKVPAESTKVKALHAMIAEKLLANEARRLDMAEDKRTALMRRQLENLLVRDELYRREVVAQSSPTDREIALGMKRLVKNVRVLSFLVRTEADGEALVRLLVMCKPDSVLGTIPSTLYAQVDTLTIRFGAPDTSFENAAYEIGRSRVSMPFRSASFGWAVLYLLDKVTDRDAAKMNLAERRHRVERILKARHEGERAEEYYYQTLQSKRALADSNVFNLLADSIEALWKEDSLHFRSHGAYILTSDMVDLLIGRLQPSLDTILVKIDDGDLTLGDVLEMFRYEDFRSQALEGEQFRLTLNETMKNLVARELLEREGRRQGLEQSPAVKNDLRLWTDYWAARSLFYRVRDSVAVNDEDVLRFLVRNKELFGRMYEVNVREVLCPTIQDADRTLDRLQRGESLAELARRYSTRTGWAEHGGESGFFVLIEHPELGFEAMNADTGTLVGPLRIPEGYSIFQVLGKKQTKDAVVGFDRLKNNVSSRLLAEKRKQTIDQYIARLAREQHVAVDYQALRRITISTVPMFTRRLVGFGGRMTAVPLLMKQWDWINDYLKPETVLP